MDYFKPGKLYKINSQYVVTFLDCDKNGTPIKIDNRFCFRALSPNETLMLYKCTKKN